MSVKNLLKSLNTDNIYVGIKAIILNQADIILKNGIKIEIEPNIKTEKKNGWILIKKVSIPLSS